MLHRLIRLGIVAAFILCCAFQEAHATIKLLQLTLCTSVSPPTGSIYSSTSISSSGTTGGTLTLSNAGSSDCTKDASTFVEDTSTGAHDVYVSGNPIAASLSAASVTVKISGRNLIGTRTSFVILNDQSFSQLAYANVNWATCSIVATASTSATAVVSGGVCQLTLNQTGVTATALNLVLYNGNNGTFASYTGDGISSLIYWGVSVNSP